MSQNYLYSIILELSPTANATIPITMGHQAHALFLDLIHQVDPALATRLHDESDYRPFTVSPLKGAQARNKSLFLEMGKIYRLRITLLDGGALWHGFSEYMLTAQTNALRLGNATFTVQRVISNPLTDPTGWAGSIDWQTLANTPAQRTLSFQFDTPTAFSLGSRQFSFFPEPLLLWDSLMRSWNLYTPGFLRIDKLPLREFVKSNIQISDYNLQTTSLYFPKYSQKGFIGSCLYQLKTNVDYAPQIAALSQFACYCGVGYKTTMGMGQARIQESPKADFSGLSQS